MKIAKLIGREGGPTAFSRETEIPLRTVEDWKAGRRKPPPWVEPLLDDAVKWRKGLKICQNCKTYGCCETSASADDVCNEHQPNS